MDTPLAEEYFFIPILFLCIVFYGIFTLWQKSLVESGKSRLERMATEETSISAVLEAQNEILSILQMALTSVGLLIGLVTTFITHALLLFLGKNYLFLNGRLIEIVIFCIVFLFITMSTLVLAKFLPERIALSAPEKYLIYNAPYLLFMFRVFQPVVKILSRLSDTVLIILGFNPHVMDTVTEDEVKDLIEQGTVEGTFEVTEKFMVDRIFHMSDQTAYSLMTPRTKILWLDLEDEPSENFRIIKENMNTFFPVGRGSLDNFLGILYAKDLLNLAIENDVFEKILNKMSFENGDLHHTTTQEKKVEKGTIDIDALPSAILLPFLHEPLFIPHSMETFRVLEKFRESQQKEAVVLDEYGGVIGFITLANIAEEILGKELPKESAKKLQMVNVSPNSWYVDGLCAIDEFKNFFNLSLLPDEEEDHYQTLGGFLLSYLGYLPKVGEKCKWENFTFEIVKMDPTRIVKILLTYTPKVNEKKT